MTVTPAMAAEWLTKNEKNRAMNIPRVRRWAKIIKDGKWRLTHQGIAFNEAGQLVDGQHRLAGIVEADQAVEMLVTHGMEFFEAVDTGRSRSAADILHISGFTNTVNLAAAIKFIHAYDNSASRLMFSNDRIHGMTPADIEEAAHDLADDLYDHYADAYEIYKRIGGGVSPFMAARYVINRWCVRNGLGPARGRGQDNASGNAADAWFEGLRSGANLGYGDPRLSLTSWALNAGRMIASQRKSEIMFFGTLRCFTASLRGETLARFIVRDPLTYYVRLPGDPAVGLNGAQVNSGGVQAALAQPDVVIDGSTVTTPAPAHQPVVAFSN
jgi:hypothetical protein